MSEELRSLLEGGGTLDAVAGHLRNLGLDGRRDALLSLGRAHQRALYALAGRGWPVSAEDLVPPGDPDTEVVHQGRNTLLVFRRFEKRFARHGDGTVYGYNEGITRRLIGPGYFVCRPCVGPVETARSAWVVDYLQVPDGPVPEGWPFVRPNWLGLQVLVFHHTRDYLRRVAPGVIIGSAYKTVLGRELALDSYFVLVRDQFQLSDEVMGTS